MREEHPSLSVTQTATADLEPGWTRLWEESPETTLFQHPAWLRIWWSHFGGDKECLVLRMRAGGRLAGVVPLCILRESGLRKIMFLGAGLSDCADGLFAQAYQTGGAAAFHAWLAQNASRWDLCDLQPLPPGSPLLGSGASFPLRHTISPAEPHTVLELPPDIAEFQARQSRHFRERMGDALRAARKLGEVRFEQADGGASLEPMLDALLRFRRMRWQGGGSAPEAFFRETARFLLGRGALRFFCLRVGGRIVAALYGFLHRNRAGLYLTGFDPAHAKASPGMLLLEHALEQFIREGAAECDFLRGREPFKHRWDVVERPYYAWRAWSRGTP